MRLTILTAGVLLSAGFAFAAHAVDEPKPLDDAKCDAAWTMASPNGDAVSKDQVTPYVINYTMVDSDADGKVSADEFNKPKFGRNNPGRVWQFSPNRPGRHDQRGVWRPWRRRKAWLLPLDLPSLFRRLPSGTP
jgi:hypothetical protein